MPELPDVPPYEFSEERAFWVPNLEFWQNMATGRVSIVYDDKTISVFTDPVAFYKAILTLMVMWEYFAEKVKTQLPGSAIISTTQSTWAEFFTANTNNPYVKKLDFSKPPQGKFAHSMIFDDEVSVAFPNPAGGPLVIPHFDSPTEAKPDVQSVPGSTPETP